MPGPGLATLNLLDGCTVKQVERVHVVTSSTFPPATAVTILPARAVRFPIATTAKVVVVGVICIETDGVALSTVAAATHGARVDPAFLPATLHFAAVLVVDLPPSVRAVAAGTDASIGTVPAAKVCVQHQTLPLPLVVDDEEVVAFHGLVHVHPVPGIRITHAWVLAHFAPSIWVGRPRKHVPVVRQRKQQLKPATVILFASSGSIKAMSAIKV